MSDLIHRHRVTPIFSPRIPQVNHHLHRFTRAYMDLPRIAQTLASICDMHAARNPRFHASNDEQTSEFAYTGQSVGISRMVGIDCGRNSIDTSRPTGSRTFLLVSAWNESKAVKDDPEARPKLHYAVLSNPRRKLTGSPRGPLPFRRMIRLSMVKSFSFSPHINPQFEVAIGSKRWLSPSSCPRGSVSTEKCHTTNHAPSCTSSPPPAISRDKTAPVWPC